MGQESKKFWGFTAPVPWPRTTQIAMHKVPICSLNYTPALAHVQEKTLLESPPMCFWALNCRMKQ